MSQMLAIDSKQFAVKAKELYHQAIFRKYLPAIVVALVVLLWVLIKWVF
jgi:hypothetical protein